MTLRDIFSLSCTNVKVYIGDAFSSSELVTSEEGEHDEEK